MIDTIKSFQVSVVDGLTGEVLTQYRTKNVDMTSFVFFQKTAELFQNISLRNKHAVLEVRPLVPQYIEKSLFV